MASIHKQKKSKFWYAAFRDGHGKLVFKSTKTTDRNKAVRFAMEIEAVAKKATAGEMHEAQIRKVIKELIEKNTDEKLQMVSVKEFFNSWLNLKDQTKSASTHERYQNAVIQFQNLLGKKADKSIEQVTPSQLQAFLTSRLKDGVSPTTAKHDIKILRTAFNHARRLGIITTNPAEAVELPKSQSVKREVFNIEEIKMLIEAANGEWKTLIRVAFYTGARLSDCCNMRWDGIDFSKGTISFDVQKTGKPMVQPLHPSLRDHLEALAGQDTPQEFILPGMARKGSGGRNGMSEGFKRIVRNAGLDLQTVQGGGKRMISKRTFHALRHSFTSHLANAGVPEDIRMKLTGHTTKAIHQGYTHHELEVLQGEMGKIESI